MRSSFINESPHTLKAPACKLAWTAIQREEEKVKKSIKDAAKRGDSGTCKLLAKEVVRSRKAVNRMHTSKAQMNSVVMQMENNLGERACQSGPRRLERSLATAAARGSARRQRNRR